MRFCNNLAVFVALLALLAPAEARTRKGEKFLKEGKEAEIRKDWDQALILFEQALSEDPADPAYQLSVNRARSSAGQLHVANGQKLRNDGKLVEALQEFERAFVIDPASSIAEQEVIRTRNMIERERKKAQDPNAANQPDTRALTPAQVAQQEVQERIERMMPVPELRPTSAQPINLKMNNQPPKVLFETVGKLAGINVLFDPDFNAQPGRPQSVEFLNTTLEQGLDHLAVLTKSFWKPLSPNTIFVTQDNTTKRRDYEEQVMKVFYLTNVNTPQELQEIATNVRSICDIRRLFTYNAQMAIIVRAEADRVALAEKLIADLDKPKAEVLVDILVMEVSRSRSRDLAATMTPTGISTPIVYNQSVIVPGTGGGSDNGGSDDGGTDATLGRRVSVGGYSIVLPNGLLEAVMSDRGSRILQSPQVRAADSFKASLKIGDKVPTASGSFQPGIGGVGVNPLVNTQFQFLDVGVNVDITPKIHYPNEVSLKVEVDLSNVRERIDLGGIEQPIIGQRKVNFEVRLREGEANVLGGLMQLQETKTVNGLPFLSAIPIVGRFFSSENIEKSESELLFVLVPHIVRTPEILEENVRPIAVGSDQVVKLSYAPRSAAGQARPAVGSAVAPAAPPTAAPAPAAPPKPVTTPVQPITPPPAQAPPPPAPGAAPAGPLAISFSQPAVETRPGGTVAVSLNVQNVQDLFTAPMRIKYDPKVVYLTDVQLGGLLGSDGQGTMPVTKNILNDAGEAVVTLSRLPGAGGIRGSGTLVTLIFQGQNAGSSKVTLQELSLRNSQLQEMKATLPELTVNVRP